MADPFRFRVATPLRWVDVDAEGVVNNAVYLSLMEQARFCYFRDLGLLERDRVPFLLAEARVRFLRPGRLGMQLATAARTVRLGNQSLVMEYEVRDGDDVLAAGSAVLVFVGADLRPVPVPAATRAAVAGFDGIDAAGAR
jgi:acyl-CoA thioester hydrolase